MYLIGASLTEPHTSVTALCTHVCICPSIYTCLDGPLTVNFKSAHSNISRGLNKPWKRAWRVTARSQGQHETEWEQRLIKLNAVCTANYFLNLWQSQVRLRATVGQQGVRWLQIRFWHDHSYIAWIPLLAHGLTVKLSPCPCSHSSLAGRIAAWVWTFQMQSATHLRFAPG